jgi:hypothetical protein
MLQRQGALPLPQEHEPGKVNDGKALKLPCPSAIGSNTHASGGLLVSYNADRQAVEQRSIQ